MCISSILLLILVTLKNPFGPWCYKLRAAGVTQEIYLSCMRMLERLLALKIIFFNQHRTGEHRIYFFYWMWMCVSCLFALTNKQLILRKNEMSWTEVCSLGQVKLAQTPWKVFANRVWRPCCFAYLLHILFATLYSLGFNMHEYCR